MASGHHENSASRPVALVILDGLGLREEREGNAVAQAQTPTLDRLRATCPEATLKTCGPDVGLPEGQMGNSEVGHMNLGAGRVVWMDLPKINNAIEDGSFATNEVLQAHINALNASGGTAHVMGLCSPGGVHAHTDHLVAAAKVVAEAGVPVKLHLFTDGRDVAPKSALDDLAALRAGLGDTAATIATVSGRFYAMDRDNRWERVEQAHAAMVEGKGLAVDHAEAAVSDAYGRGETDEFIQPSVVGEYAGMRDGDGVLMVNFRSDRAREVLDALGAEGFGGFERRAVAFAAATGMVEYSEQHSCWMGVLFPKEPIVNTLGETVEAAGLSQFRLAETEKYPHVTFFLNGGAETPLSGEQRHMEPSPKVKTYDLQPEMSASGVTEALLKAIGSGAHDLYVVNYANPDMVGHTGDLNAAIDAVEAVDSCLGKVVDAIAAEGGAMIVTADHGNCEMMIDPETGGPHTAHTLNEVPIWLVGRAEGLSPGGRLADVAPTLLAMLGVAQPSDMTGRSLLVEGAS
jgi:2,3-bisphosphoglycerate-independent phosphoglycerate mutase